MEIEVKKLTVDLLNDWLEYFDNAAFTDDDEWPGCYCMHFHSWLSFNVRKAGVRKERSIHRGMYYYEKKTT